MPLPRLLRKIAAQASLMRQDPERFARNVMQLTHPALFEERLSDILNAVPMYVRVDPALADRPSLNVLSSALTENGMTGGPNTIVNLAFRIARLGVPVRMVTTVETSHLTPGWFARHAAQLIGDTALPAVPIVTAADPARPLAVGPKDVFLASHWTTAQQLKPVLDRMEVRQFLYILQEFEPAFYPWSSNYALAIETYGLDFWPVINQGLLAEFLFAQPLGRLADPSTRDRATVFEPAIESRLFKPPAVAAKGPPRLLFYARPSNTRNLFGLGLASLREVAADPVFKGWEFLAIGGRGGVPDLPIGGGHVLRPAPWKDYEGYAQSLQAADVLLCPMLSPHTSYPVLEMAACGGLSVTNSFATKTAERLAELSPDIVTAEPTVAGFARALRVAAARASERRASGEPRTSRLAMARDWAETLDPAAARLAGIFADLSG
jgi:hypothetical protein